MSGIECARWTSSSSNGPRLTFSPGGSSCSGASRELVLVELGADHADRQQAAVDHRRRADLAQHVGQGADVVLVAVGEHDRLDVVGAVAQVGEVGQDEVDPVHLRGREHQPGVDDDDLAVELDDGHVLADLAEAAQAAALGVSYLALVTHSLLKLMSTGATGRPMPSSAASDRCPLLGVRWDQRQPHPLRGEAEHLQRRLERNRVGGHRETLVERGQLGVDLARPVEVARLRRRPTSRASAAPTTCEATVMPPAPPNSSTRRKVLSLPARIARPSIGPSSSSLACLTATMLSTCGQLGEQVGWHVDDHPRGDVVHDHRQLGNRLGDRLEVGAQAGSVGLVVVRGDDQRGVGAGLGGHLGQFARVAGVVGAGAADQQHLVADLGPHRPQQLDRLLVGQGRALAAGAGDDEAVRAVLEQVGGETPRGVRVDCARARRTGSPSR